MRIKCTACQEFVPVAEKAYRYCAWCGNSLMSHPAIPNLREHIDQTVAAQRHLHAVQGGVFLFILVLMFVVFPRFPQPVPIFLFIGTFLASFFFRPIIRKHIIAKYPTTVASEHWEP